MVEIATFLKDIFSFIKSDLAANLSISRVYTSYPQKAVTYPTVSLKIPNFVANRSGMQTVAMDIVVPVEVRVWAKNEKDKDDISNAAFDRLRNIQFTTGGSVDNNLHDFKLLSAVEIDEDGDQGIKSRIMQVQYSFFNVS